MELGRLDIVYLEELAERGEPAVRITAINRLLKLYPDNRDAYIKDLAVAESARHASSPAAEK